MWEQLPTSAYAQNQVLVQFESGVIGIGANQLNVSLENASVANPLSDSLDAIGVLAVSGLFPLSNGTSMLRHLDDDSEVEPAGWMVCFYLRWTAHWES